MPKKNKRISNTLKHTVDDQFQKLLGLSTDDKPREWDENKLQQVQNDIYNKRLNRLYQIENGLFLEKHQHLVTNPTSFTAKEPINQSKTIIMKKKKKKKNKRCSNNSS